MGFVLPISDTACGAAAARPDPYVLFKSQRVTVGQRPPEGRHRKAAAHASQPTFLGPFLVSFGGPKDAEQLSVELWNRSSDERLQQVSLDFSDEAVFGRRTFKTSGNGSVALTWRLNRSTATTGESKLQIHRLSADARDLPWYLLVTGQSLDTQERWDWNAEETQQTTERELSYDPQGYLVELWQPESTGDVLLAEGSLFPTVSSTRSTVVVDLSNGGRLEILYSVEIGVGPEPSPPVVRKEVRLLEEAEQQRFLRALQRLMENQDGVQSSSFFRLAAYHGWPEDYCVHGQETFPGWHRAYLRDFERALIEADKALNNDGDLGVPYWDWTRLELNGQILPNIIRQSFEELPSGLVDPAQAGRLAALGYQLPTEEQLRQNLVSLQVVPQAESSLTVPEHWLHASTRFSMRGFSVESSHNGVHVALGFPMNTVPYAAFHPIFFLHHSNVDRIYEKHVQMETPEECAREFAARQRSLAEQGETNRFLQPLEPFQLNDRPLMPADTFDTARLGYVYDELPPDPPQLMTEEPIFVAFENIQVLALKQKSYKLHVFLTSEGGWSYPSSHDWSSIAGYAGAGAIFGGRAEECENCRKRPPFTVLVEVRATLEKLGLSRHEAEVHVLCEDELGEVLPLADTAVPAPVLLGPWFENDGTLRLHSAGSEVLQLQKALFKLGYLPEMSCTGIFDTITEEAVKEFQRFSGLKETDVCDASTKGLVTAQRYDVEGDVISGGALPHLGPLVTYAVGALPGYLQGAHRCETLREIDEAIQQWAEVVGLTFQRTSELHARLQVSFQPLGAPPSPGGQLAQASAQGIVLDSSERWLLRSQKKPQRFRKAFYLYPVVLHEMGHCLGMKHSSNRDDVMWPYYREDLWTLSDADKAAARGMRHGDCTCNANICVIS